MGALKDPHGGVLKNLYLDEAGVKQEKARARDLPSWDLNMRQLCDIEMLLNGAFSPLEGFLGEADYRRVLSDMRLTSGVLWPMPITLDVTRKIRREAQGRRHDRAARRRRRPDGDDGDLEHLSPGFRRRGEGGVRHD